MGAIQCPVLIGRDAELEILTQALDQADQGGSLIFLAGEPGVGKSRIAREFSAIAANKDFTIVCGRAVQAASPVPFRPIIEALIGVARSSGIPDIPVLAEYRLALAALVPDWSINGARAAEISPLIIGEALLRLLTCLGGKGTLLVLEDLQFADPETLAIVEYLADNSGGERVLCVGTLRDSEPSAALDMVRSVHSRRAASVVNLPRLSGDAIRQMITASLDLPQADSALLDRLLADCDGLPFAVEEMLAAAVSSGELVFTAGTGWRINDEISTGVPTSIAESVRRRLAELGPQTAGIITCAAVLGRQFDWTLLRPMANASETEVLSALRAACDAQLIEPPCPGQVTFRFQHSMTRDAIVSGLLPPILAGHSASGAAAIEAVHPALPGAWCELAADLHETAGQLGQAGALLLEAGRRACQRGALTSAAILLDRAWQALTQAGSPQPQMLADIDDVLVNVHMLAGNCDQLVRTAGRLLAELDAIAAPPPRKAEIVLRIAMALSEGDRVAEAEQQVAVARALIEDSPVPGQAWADAVEARCAIDSGQHERALRLARRALATTQSLDLAGCAAEAACEALETIGRCERISDTTTAKAAFERAYQISSDYELPVRRIRAMHELGTIEMLEEAKAGRLAEAKRLALESGAVSTATLLDLQLANAWSLGADTDRALIAAQHCQQSARRLRMSRVEAMALGAQACVAAVRGDAEAAETLAEQADQLAPGDASVRMTTWGEARVTAAIVANDLPAALNACAAGIRHGRRERITAPSMAWGYWGLLEVVAGQDGRQAMSEALAAGAEVACWNRGLLAYAQAVLAGQDGDAARAEQLAEAGRAEFARCAPWWNHILHRLVAPSAFRDGWGDPARWLREAIGDLEDAGLDQLASACRGMLRQAGERVPRCGRGNARVPAPMRRMGVTSREMDVFLLIGQGRSNGEIAKQLFISPKTVETHVSNLVTKSGVDCRRQLIALAAGAPGG